ncbi:thioredoxin domain-containing protein [Candidatus Poribacteria bacterium]
MMRCFPVMTMALFLITGVTGLALTDSSLEQEEHEYTNFLIHEKSPYLLQHAHNPVNWYPWGDAAFEKARKESKPIFLSIGYATCHWCHVMEKESFANPEIAAIMNEFFVCIKVDREERPDIDKLYMTAASSAGWGGGWPLSMWLTPDLKPFYGGTYFPPHERWGRPGFSDILKFIAEKWENDREKLLAAGEQLTQHLKGYTAAAGRSGTPAPEALESGLASYKESHDSSLGGFGNTPKFPMPVNHNFLLRYYARSGNEEALQMSLHTLREMAKGGIYDHIGGGFHRYSTDAKWHIPHFEKMLYDNAQIIVNYLDAYQITKEEGFAQVARETLEYVLRDMTHAEGGFFSAEDADSLPPELAGKVSDETHEHKSEGAFYIWKMEEILSIIGKETGAIFSYRYGVRPKGNAESDPQGEFEGENILYAAHSIVETAKEFGKTESEVLNILEESKQKLFEVRAKRPRSGLDDKILVSWNGLMISALARASQVLDEPRYLKAAERASRFTKSEIYDSENKRLFRRWRENERKVTGTASDYAFLIQGLIDLYEASFDIGWLNWAVELTEEQNSLFYDQENGGFYMTASDHDDNLIVRMKGDSDNVEPSAASVATLSLLRLSQFTDSEDFLKIAEKTLTLFGDQMKRHPRSLPQMLVALDYYLSKPQQIIIVGDLDSPDTQEMLKAVHQRFIPSKILVVLSDEESQKAVRGYLPFVENLARINDRATAYVCVNYTCALPTNDVQVMSRVLDGNPL